MRQAQHSPIQKCTVPYYRGRLIDITLEPSHRTKKDPADHSQIQITEGKTQTKKLVCRSSSLSCTKYGHTCTYIYIYIYILNYLRNLTLFTCLKLVNKKVIELSRYAYFNSNALESILRKIYSSNIEHDVTTSMTPFVSRLPRECMSRYFFDFFFHVYSTDKSAF